MSSSTSTSQISGGLLSLSPGASGVVPQAGASLTATVSGDSGSFYTLWMGITAQGQMATSDAGSLRQNPVTGGFSNGMELPPETAEQLLQKLDQLLQQVDEGETDLLESAVDLLRLGLQQTAPDGQIVQADSIELSESEVSDAELLAYLKTLLATPSANTEAGSTTLSDSSLPLSDGAKEKLVSYLEQKLELPAAQNSTSTPHSLSDGLSTEEMAEAERVVRQLWTELESARQARVALSAEVDAETAKLQAAEAAADDLQRTGMSLEKTTESRGIPQGEGGAGRGSDVTPAVTSEANPPSSDLDGVIRQSDNPIAKTAQTLAGESQMTGSDDKADRLVVPLERPAQSREAEKERERRFEPVTGTSRESAMPLRPVSEVPRVDPAVAVLDSSTPEGRSASIEQVLSDRLKVAMSEERSTTVAARTESSNLQSAEAQRMAMPSSASPQVPIQQAQNAQDALMQKMLNPAWSKALGERAVMMAQQGPRMAEVRLDPPELGSLRIRVQIHGSDQVSLSFNAPNAAVREVLEQSMPRLREMFAEQGLNLADASVGDQSTQDRADKDPRDAVAKGFAGSGGDDFGDDFGDAPASRVGGRKIGLIDYYA